MGTAGNEKELKDLEKVYVAEKPLDSARAGGEADSGGRKSNPTAAACFLIFLPWITYYTITVLYAFVYHHFRAVVWLASLGFVALAAFLLSLSSRMHRRVYTFSGILPLVTYFTITLSYALVCHHWVGANVKRFLFIVCLASVGIVALAVFLLSLSSRMHGRGYSFSGILTLVAVVAGNIVGVYIYSQFFSQYWAYDMNPTYANVLPSEPAAAYADAGIIKFASSARIDTTKAVGYKSGKVTRRLHSYILLT